MWDLPGPGLEPLSPALAGGFLTITPTGEVLDFFLEGSVVALLMARSPWGSAGCVGSHRALLVGRWGRDPQ